VGTSSTSYLPPFEQLFGDGLVGGQPSRPGEACFGKSFRNFDREGNSLLPGCGFPECPITFNQYFCYETQVITFNQSDVEPGVRTNIFGSMLGINDPASSNSGWMELTLSVDAQQALRPSNEGNAFPGLPIAGFLAVNYVNANVTPGVLSNYSATYPHRSHASCANSTNPQSTCP